MDRSLQPAMDRPRQGRRAASGRARDSDPDRVGAFRRSWAVTRWVVMVVAIGVATGAAIAITITVLLNLLDANL